MLIENQKDMTQLDSLKGGFHGILGTHLHVGLPGFPTRSTTVLD